jgi:hypothetical protein
MKSIAAYVTPQLLAAYKSVLGNIFRVDPSAITILAPDAPPPPTPSPPPSAMRRRRALLALEPNPVTYDMYVTVFLFNWDQVAYITDILDTTSIQSVLDAQYAVYVIPPAYIQYSSVHITDLAPTPTPTPALPPSPSPNGEVVPGPFSSASPGAPHSLAVFPLAAALIFSVLHIFN